MGLLKLGAVIFVSYTIGGRAGEYVLSQIANGPVGADSITGARWAGRAVSFVGLGYLASKL